MLIETNIQFHSRALKKTFSKPYRRIKDQMSMEGLAVGMPFSRESNKDKSPPLTGGALS